MFRKLLETRDENPNSRPVTVFIDNEPVAATSGETIAALMLRQADIWVRTAPLTQSRRAPYCMMGVCFECLMTVDGIASVQTCMTQVADGMRIMRQTGARSIGRNIES